jgi:putative transposase
VAEGEAGGVNERLLDASRQRIQSSMKRGQPLGNERWTQSIARRLGLQFTLDPRGRPRKNAAGKEAK